MEPWYKVATPRKEVREGRSFNPDEFAIALEQVVAGTGPPPDGPCHARAGYSPHTCTVPFGTIRRHRV